MKNTWSFKVSCGGLFSILLLASLVEIPKVLAAPKDAEGTFVAEQVCPAYQSKNKKTNPGNWQTAVSVEYPVIQVIESTTSSWIRIKMTGAEPLERWVSSDCGKPEYKITQQGPSPELITKCQTPNLAKSYVFAVSWQHGFCQTLSDYNPNQKPECEISDTTADFAENFVIHGLWPNNPDCSGGKNIPWYGYCGEVKNKPNNNDNDNSPSFCGYPPIELSDSVRTDLEKHMPSAKYGSCLQRHEWHNHGTCQEVWNPDEYYTHSIKLLKQINNSPFATLVRDRVENTISIDEIKLAWQESFGENSDSKLKLKCKELNDKTYLTELQIALPLDVQTESNIRTLLSSESSDIFSTIKCGDAVYIDKIGR